MGVEKFLEIWSQYNIPLIQGLFGFILILILFLAFKNFFSAGHDELSAGMNPELEKTLQKILEQSQKHPGSFGSEMSASHIDLPGEESENNSDGEADGARAEEVKKLQESLVEKDLVIAELKKNQGAASAGGGEDSKVLKDQIKLLEERLSEYEIIAEDIADLSKFKDENSQLQREIEKLKASGGSAPEPVIEKPQAAPASPPPVEEPAVVDPVPAPSVVENAPAADSGPEMDDLEKEFQALVEAQKAGSLSQQEAASTAAAVPEAEVVLQAPPPMPTVEDTQMDIDAILAQHSASEPPVVEAAPKSDDNKLLGDFEKFIENKEEKG